MSRSTGRGRIGPRCRIRLNASGESSSLPTSSTRWCLLVQSIPVEQKPKFEPLVNPITVSALGLTFPTVAPDQRDKVVE
jgi:hypothetical protein